MRTIIRDNYLQTMYHFTLTSDPQDDSTLAGLARLARLALSYGTLLHLGAWTNNLHFC